MLFYKVKLSTENFWFFILSKKFVSHELLIFLYNLYLLLGVTNGENKEKMMDQTTIALETYYCVNFHVLSDYLN